MSRLDGLIETAKLLGRIQGRKETGNYSREDAVIERALHELLERVAVIIRLDLVARRDAGLRGDNDCV